MLAKVKREPATRGSPPGVSPNRWSKPYTGPQAKARALAWAVAKETEAQASKRGEVPPGKTFAELLTRYKEEISVNKPGAKWEITRIDMIVRDYDIAKVLLTNLSSDDVASWKKQRSKEVKPASVRREWTILSHACSEAMKPGWRWLQHNPFKEVDRPEKPASRTRVMHPEERDTILYTLGCDAQVTPVTVNQRVGFATRFALVTAMRAGEITKLRWKDVDGKVARLGTELRVDGKRNTKNGYARTVPLFPEALRLLALLPRGGPEDRVFQLNDRQLDVLFRKARDKALVKDLHFHDTRRTALTHMATPRERGGMGIDLMTLAKISGHRDLRILQETYYAVDMGQVAETYA